MKSPHDCCGDLKEGIRFELPETRSPHGAVIAPQIISLRAPLDLGLGVMGSSRTSYLVPACNEHSRAFQEVGIVVRFET